LLVTRVWHSAFQSVGMFACVNTINSSNGHDSVQPAQRFTPDFVARTASIFIITMTVMTMTMTIIN